MSAAEQAGAESAVTTAASARPDEKVGVFGAQKRAEALLLENAGLARARAALASENERLRHRVDALLGMDSVALAAEAAKTRAEVMTDVEQSQASLAEARRQESEAIQVRDNALAEARAAMAELTAVRARVVATDEVAALQEVGIYEYRHPLRDAVAYKSRLADAKDKAKAMVSSKTAVRSSTTWTVNGSRQQGSTMTSQVSRLMLRAYNAEADHCVRTLRPHALQSAIARLDKTREAIARLGAAMNIQISDAYHRVRILELELTADYLSRQDEERERVRAERERQREDAAASRDFERERTRLKKEQTQYSLALAQLHTRGDSIGVTEMRERLDQVAESLDAVDRRAANTRAGYVYVISNIGSFGESIIKIGMTRRLDPRERVHELGSASVPFQFDVHAFIFSDDAVTLETQLHHALEHCRVNQVNRRREFFRATPAEVLALLERVAGSHLVEFTETPEALEWRASYPALPSADPGAAT